MMNIRFVAPFVQAARDVLMTEAHTEVVVERWSIHPAHHRPTRGLSVIVPVTGRLGGYVLYNIATPVALHLVQAMLGERIDGLDQVARSGLAELANVISGTASIYLERMGFACILAPPALVTLDDLALFRDDSTCALDPFSDLPPDLRRALSSSRIAVPLQAPMGMMSLEVGLRNYA